MRVTIDIPDELHARIKEQARREGTTMRAIILRALGYLVGNDGNSPQVEPQLQRRKRKK
jgi:hypothetical protein